MKTLLIAVNAKYTHSCLAVWYLKAACIGRKLGQIKVLEFTINENIEYVINCIYDEKPDVLAFSCYIWNIEIILKIIPEIKKIIPNIRIILGGPEVSFDSGNLLKEDKFVDFITSGEGEKYFPDLLQDIKYNILELEKNNSENKFVGGYKQYTDKKNEYYIDVLDNINSPYTEEYLRYIKSSNKIIYMETSRGCPYNCSYCLSSTNKGIRYFSLDRVKYEISKVIDYEIPKVKFIDRTFNSNPNRAIEIFEYIIREVIKKKKLGKINFHFEIKGENLDDNLLKYFKNVPHGLFQFEIGVQSTNVSALSAVERKSDIIKLAENVKRIAAYGNIHLHLDLIAGLPKETLDSFRNSFNDVYRMHPNVIQLGFLKLLKGTKIRNEALKFGYVYREYPPYEILCNKFISYSELKVLKEIEDVVEKFYNSKRFLNSLSFLIDNYFVEPYEFFLNFSNFLKTTDYYRRPYAARDLYKLFISFVCSIVKTEREKLIILELIKLDFLARERTKVLPQGLLNITISDFKENCFKFLKKKENLLKYIPEYVDVPAKFIYKDLHFEIFEIDVLDINIKEDNKKHIIIFNYNNVNKINEYFQYIDVTEDFEF